MARVELIMPKMGESVSEATVISWKKEVGEMVELDETIIEIATDKVDSEVPSTYEGKLVEKLFKADDVVKVGQPFAILETEGGEDTPVAETIAPSPVAAEEIHIDPLELLFIRKSKNALSSTVNSEERELTSAATSFTSKFVTYLKRW